MNTGTVIDQIARESFGSQAAMAQAAGTTPATLNRIITGSFPKAETLCKILAACTATDRQRILYAVVRDIIPADYHAELMDQDGRVRDEPPHSYASRVPPYARAVLEHLAREAASDPDTIAYLESIGNLLGVPRPDKKSTTYRDPK